MAKLLIVYSSLSGNTAAMAKAVAEGAQSAGASVVLKPAVEADAADLLACDVLAVGTPNYFGYMSGLVKDFFDRVWGTVRDKVASKPYVTFGSKGGGGAQALDSVENICNAVKMRRVADGILATRQPTEAVLQECREMGKKLARPESLAAPPVKEPRL